MDEPQGANYKWWQIFLPDRGGWFFCYLFFGLLFMRPELLLWDGGSCRHILNGVLMLQNHRIPSDNYTSWVYPNIEVVTRSWLADLISGAFYQQFHLIGVVFICGLVIALGLTWSYQMGRARGLGLLSGLLMLAIVMGTVGMHWSARSHVYSYLPFLALYYFVFMSGAGWVRALIIGAIMCVWANLHGSFTIGMGMIAAALAGDLLQFFRKKGGAADRFKVDTISFACAVLFTCLNPRGISLYTTIWNYLANPNVVHKTDEWRGFDIFAGLGSWAFLVLLAVLITLVIKTRKVPSAAETLVLVGLCLSGFESMRLIPYCALIAMPFMGPAWNQLRQQVPPASEATPDEKHRSWWQKLIKIERKAEVQEKSGIKLSLCCCAIALVMGILAMTLPFSAVKDFDAERLPVQEVNYLQEHHIEGRGFNYDNWGGYIYFKTNRRVFIDDWGDFLPASFIDEYLQILLTNKGWEQPFKSRGFDWVLAPSEAQICQVLSQSPDWTAVCKDKAGTLLIRKDIQK